MIIDTMRGQVFVDYTVNITGIEWNINSVKVRSTWVQKCDLSEKVLDWFTGTLWGMDIVKMIIAWEEKAEQDFINDI